MGLGSEQSSQMKEKGIKEAKKKNLQSLAGTGVPCADASGHSERGCCFLSHA